MEFRFVGLSGVQWLDLGISFLIVLTVIVLGRFVVSFLVNKIIRRLSSKTQTVLDDVLADVLCIPLYLFPLVLAFDVAYKRLDFLPIAWESWEDDLFYILYLVVGFVFTWRFVRNFFILYGKEMATRT